jgi:hydroxymethylpyrimidine pyrophosphatase-like HAD family hydrolase
MPHCAVLSDVTHSEGHGMTIFNASRCSLFHLMLFLFQVVKLMKESKTNPTTAAIGDGANDVSMIQEAHIGLGITWLFPFRR